MEYTRTRTSKCQNAARGQCMLHTHTRTAMWWANIGEAAHTSSGKWEEQPVRGGVAMFVEWLRIEIPRARDARHVLSKQSRGPESA